MKHYILLYFLILIFISVNLNLFLLENKLNYYINKNEELKKELAISILTKEINNEEITFSKSYFDNCNNKTKYFVNELSKFKYKYYLISTSKAYGYDWKLFAIQIFYESNFESLAQSNTGAKGLMQLTRWVYNKDADPFNEIHNIFIGISYFDYLYNKFEYIKNDNERLKFTFAAYHDGLENIEEYRKIVEYNNLNSYKYSNIEIYLTNECQKYVNNIFLTYEDVKEYL